MPTETTAPRLIDANALKERMNSDFWSNTADLVDALEIIDSAPTVETTDDVMGRLPKNFRYTFETKSDTYEVWTRDSDSERTLKLGYWKTPLEALKKLEASLNPK